MTKSGLIPPHSCRCNSTGRVMLQLRMCTKRENMLPEHEYIFTKWIYTKCRFRDTSSRLPKRWRKTTEYQGDCSADLNDHAPGHVPIHIYQIRKSQLLHSFNIHLHRRASFFYGDGEIPSPWILRHVFDLLHRF